MVGRVGRRVGRCMRLWVLIERARWKDHCCWGGRGPSRAGGALIGTALCESESGRLGGLESAAQRCREATNQGGADARKLMRQYAIQ